VLHAVSASATPTPIRSFLLIICRNLLIAVRA
jgi:hypothetical protein